MPASHLGADLRIGCCALIQLPGHAPGKSKEDDSSAWALNPCKRLPGGGSWILTAVWRMNQKMEDISLCFFLFQYNSNFQIKKIKHFNIKNKHLTLTFK